MKCSVYYVGGKDGFTIKDDVWLAVSHLTPSNSWFLLADATRTYKIHGRSDVGVYKLEHRLGTISPLDKYSKFLFEMEL